MRSIFIAALLTAFVGVAVRVDAQSTAETMQKKLDAAERLLRAIVLEDFEEVEEHAKELDSLAEFQSWFVLPTPEYARHSDEFRDAAQAVSEAGGKSDQEAASDAFRTMFDKCVQCHQYMKSVREPPDRR